MGLERVPHGLLKIFFIKITERSNFLWFDSFLKEGAPKTLYIQFAHRNTNTAMRIVGNESNHRNVYH